MKQLPDPQEPHQHGPDPQDHHQAGSGSQEALSSSASYSGSDSEILRGEEQLLAALGAETAESAEPAERLDQPFGAGVDSAAAPEARTEFRDRLRSQFLAPSSGLAKIQVSDRAMEKLEEWIPPVPCAAFRDELRASFLAATVGAASGITAGSYNAESDSAQDDDSVLTPVRRRRAVPAPARSTRFRLVAVGSVLAAAAAALFILRTPDSVQPPMEVPAQAGSATVDLANVEVPLVADPESAAPEGTVEKSGWAIDVDFGLDADLLAAVRIDGEPVDSMEDFVDRMASAVRVESVGREIRIRHKQEFVLELAADTAFTLGHWSSGTDGAGGQRILVEAGGLRVATGPDFSPESPLVVETADVRTQVVGTIFGVDVGVGYTCVCCFEGAVETVPKNGIHPKCTVCAGSTQVVALGDVDAPEQIQLVDHHRGALEGLASYWG